MLTKTTKLINGTLHEVSAGQLFHCLGLHAQAVVFVFYIFGRVAGWWNT